MTDRPAQHQDPHIEQLQTAWLESYRFTRRMLLCLEPDGSWSVHEHTMDGVAPMSSYPTAALAAARLLQLLGLKEPVTPQNYPESVCIGSVETREAP